MKSPAYDLVHHRRFVQSTRPPQITIIAHVGTVLVVSALRVSRIGAGLCESAGFRHGLADRVAQNGSAVIFTQNRSIAFDEIGLKEMFRAKMDDRGKCNMGEFSERLLVRCPYDEASKYLAAFVSAHQAGDRTVRISLPLPISRSKDRRPLGQRPVVATFYPLRSIADRCPTYSVTWLPKGDGPSPEFAGALAVERSARDDRFGLVLSGHCEEMGLPTTFDVTRGRRIERTSVRDVLRSIANYIEKAHAHEEAARASRRSPVSQHEDRLVEHGVDVTSGRTISVDRRPSWAALAKQKVRPDGSEPSVQVGERVSRY